MMIANLSSEAWTAKLVTHLWQSTIVASGIWLLACALRKNHARVRYWVWFAASMKFLMPFALLIAAGEGLQSLQPAMALAHPALISTVTQVAQPFIAVQFVDATPASLASHPSLWLSLVLLAWACGVVVVLLRFACGWRRVNRAKRSARLIDIRADVPVLATRELIEPGIFGIFRPVLLLPEGILDRLTVEQLRTIVSHEMAHVRRHDNLTFAMHMFVETLFWFYPLVWWIGARLIEERERACDEAVVVNDTPQTYAEGILSVCRFYVESPVACVSGVTGADLKTRIARILTGEAMQSLDPGRKLLLAAVACAAFAIPVALGLVCSGPSFAESKPNHAEGLPRFDVVSIKPHKEESMATMRLMTSLTPDGFSAEGMSLDMLIRQAFNLPPDRILNLPDWVKSARFDIEAKVAPEDAPKLEALSPKQRLAMLIPVFEDRFGLKFHQETRNLNVYTLVVAKGGPKLIPAKPGDDGAELPTPDATHVAAAGGDAVPPKPGADNRPPAGAMMMRMSTQGMTLISNDTPTAMLCEFISQQIGSTVVDRTGLTGKYDLTLSFMPDMAVGQIIVPGPGAGPAGDASPEKQDASGPSIFAALQEQLGLKLESQKVPADVIMIDRLEKPSAN